MDARVVEKLAQSLLAGELPQADPLELGAAAQSLADALARQADGPAPAAIGRALDVLNRHRHFDHARLLGQAWVACRAFDATIQRQLAQALINLSALAEAEPLLRAGLARLPDSAAATRERLEYEGLLARIAKQRFADEGDPAALMTAGEAYLDTYRRHPLRPYWHGVNAVALLARQRREGMAAAAADGTTHEALASEIRLRLSTTWNDDPGDPWLASTLSECCLALGLCDEAELWLYRFLNHPRVSPFAIDSYDRQLREIWQGNPLGPGPACPSRLATIMARHLMQAQSRLTIAADQVQAMTRQLAEDPALFEKNFSGERSFSLDLLRNMLASCASIGCVSNRRGERLGTGFLVAGEALRPGWGAAPVFVTNAHVIGTEVPNAIALDDALVSFEVESAAAGAPVYYPVAELLYSSPPGPLGMRHPQQDGLDVSIVRLAGIDAGRKGLDVALRLPLIDAKAKAYVVGHPLGSGLQVSVHDSLLLDVDDDQRLVHYRTPTDPGSSGSPVFNGSWRVMALHHGGSPTMPRLHGNGDYAANEGIALGAIQRKLGSL